MASKSLPDDNGDGSDALLYAGADVRYIDVQRVYLGGDVTQSWIIDIDGTGTDPFA